MKVRENNLVDRSGTFDQIAQIVPLGLDVNSIHQIIKTLTDLYSDPELAVIREYPTNAADSHKAVGNTAPIQITLPTQLQPRFIVQDFGKGMSLDEITKNFSKYGYSSKRDSDEFTGILGLGCKSGLTYTSSLSLIAVQNGIKTTVLIVRGTDDVGQLQVLDTCSTDEPDGVTIEVPVSNWQTFARKARDFFRFWDPGTVEIDGEMVESLFERESLFPLDPDVLITNAVSRDYIVMGGVPYPVERLNAIGLKNGTYVVARVEIGVIDFVPSREALQLTKRTKEVVDDLRSFVSTRLRRHVQSEIDKCETHWDAMVASSQWSNRITFSDALTYRGERIPLSIAAEGQVWSVPNQRMSPYRKSSSLSSFRPLEWAKFPGKVILFGHPARSMDRKTKNALVDHGGISEVFVVHRMAKRLYPWISGIKTMDYEDLLPRDVRLPGMVMPRKPVEKWLVRTGKIFYETSEIPDDKPIVYFLKTDNPLNTGYRYRHYNTTREDYRIQLGNFLDGQGLDVTLVMVGSTFVERFKREFPASMTIVEYFQSEVDRIDAVLTDDDLIWHGGSHFLDSRQPEEFLDKKLQKFVRRIQACESPDIRKMITKRTALVNEGTRYCPGGKVESNRAEPKSDIRDVLGEWSLQFKLVRSGAYSLTDHEVDYINAMFLYGRRKKQN